MKVFIKMTWSQKIPDRNEDACKDEQTDAFCFNKVASQNRQAEQTA